jgi:hypothetical protein
MSVFNSVLHNILPEIKLQLFITGHVLFLRQRILRSIHINSQSNVNYILLFVCVADSLKEMQRNSPFIRSLSGVTALTCIYM